MKIRLVLLGGLGAGLSAGLTALCCVTPLVATGLAAIGLAGLAAYLDFVMLALLFAFLGIMAVGLLLRKQRCSNLQHLDP